MNHLHCNLFLRDEDYIRELKAGGQRADTAISCLYLKYRKRTHSYIRKLASRHEGFRGVPDDLVHDAFIIMLDKLRHDAPMVQSLAGYWIGICKNLFLNQLKKDQRTILVNDAEEKYRYENDTPESLFFDREEQLQLEAAFSALGQRCRDILMLWLNQYSMVEIAQKMNLSNDAMARKIKFECFKKLKELVKKGNKA
jgi:RNA polymerase sigma factor (sigma-70 family)